MDSTIADNVHVQHSFFRIFRWVKPSLLYQLGRENVFLFLVMDKNLSGSNHLDINYIYGRVGAHLILLRNLSYIDEEGGEEEHNAEHNNNIMFM